MLIIPWMGRYMIGTTDIRFDEDPDDARCDIGEVDYLLGEVNALIPGANLTLDDVLYTFSGVRPLPYVPDKAESVGAAQPRAARPPAPGCPGLVTVVGGKLTTYRQLAEDAVDDAFKRLGRKAPRCVTRSRRSRAPSSIPCRSARDLVAAGVPERTADRLVNLYGSRAADVVAVDDPELLAEFDPSPA